MVTATEDALTCILLLIKCYVVQGYVFPTCCVPRQLCNMSFALQAKHSELVELFEGRPGFQAVYACPKGEKYEYFVDFADDNSAEAVHDTCQVSTMNAMTQHCSPFVSRYVSSSPISLIVLPPW